MQHKKRTIKPKKNIVSKKDFQRKTRHFSFTRVLALSVMTLQERFVFKFEKLCLLRANTVKLLLSVPTCSLYLCNRFFPYIYCCYSRRLWGHKETVFHLCFCLFLWPFTAFLYKYFLESLCYDCE